MPPLLIEMQKLLSTMIKLFCKESSSFRIALVSSLCAQALLLHSCCPAFWQGFRRSALLRAGLRRRKVTLSFLFPPLKRATANRPLRGLGLATNAWGEFRMAAWLVD